jgi:hypothetical protein
MDELSGREGAARPDDTMYGRCSERPRASGELTWLGLDLPHRRVPACVVRSADTDPSCLVAGRRLTRGGAAQQLSRGANGCRS